jgi:hypothetical protein
MYKTISIPFFVLFLAIAGGGNIAAAQTAAHTVTAHPAPVQAAAPAEGAPKEAAPASDLQERMALATKMADITPPSDAVNLAIRAIAAQAPQDQRAMVEKDMINAFEYQKFHDFVVKTMAESFTLAELKAMVAYYGSPEAASIAHKMQGYQSKIQPKMTQMVDTAMMVVRTGGGADYKQGAKPPQ